MENKKPKFALDFVGFTMYGPTAEATIIINPEFTITGVVEMQHSEDSMRAVNLIFSRKQPKLGRRGYSLKQEWEQNPQKTLVPEETKLVQNRGEKK